MCVCGVCVCVVVVVWADSADLRRDTRSTTSSDLGVTKRALWRLKSR